MSSNRSDFLCASFILLFLIIEVFGTALAPTPAAAQTDASSEPQAALFAFSRDGNTLASVAEDGWITVLDLASGQERATLAGPVSGVTTGLAFSPDANTLASAADDTIILWNVASGDGKRNLGRSWK